MHLSNDGSWDLYINNATEKAWKKIGVMRSLKIRLDRLSLQIIYFSFIRLILEYGDVIWGNLSQGLKDQLDKARIAIGTLLHYGSLPFTL